MRPQFSQTFSGKEARLVFDNEQPRQESPIEKIQKGFGKLIEAGGDFADAVQTQVGNRVQDLKAGLDNVRTKLFGASGQTAEGTSMEMRTDNFAQNIVSRLSLEGQIAIRDSKLQIQNISIDISGGLRVIFIQGNEEKTGVASIGAPEVPGDKNADTISVSGGGPNGYHYVDFKVPAVEAALLRGLGLTTAPAAKASDGKAKDAAKPLPDRKPPEAKTDGTPDAKPEGKNETVKEQVTRELQQLRKEYDDIFNNEKLSEAQKNEQLTAKSMEIFFKTLELFVASVPQLHEKIYGKRENAAGDKKDEKPAAKPGETGKTSTEKAPDAKVGDLEKKLARQKEDLSDANTAITAKEKQSGEMQKTIDQMKKTHDAMSDKDSAKAQILKGEIDDQTEQKAIVDRRLAMLKNAKAKLESSIAETQKELDAAKKAAAEKPADKADGDKAENVDALKLLQEALKILPEAVQKIMGIVTITAKGIEFAGGVLEKIFNLKSGVISFENFAAKRVEIMQAVLTKLDNKDLQKALEKAGLLAGVVIEKGKQFVELAGTALEQALMNLKDVPELFKQLMNLTVEQIQSLSGVIIGEILSRLSPEQLVTALRKMPSTVIRKFAESVPARFEDFLRSLDPRRLVDIMPMLSGALSGTVISRLSPDILRRIVENVPSSDEILSRLDPGKLAELLKSLPEGIVDRIMRNLPRETIRSMLDAIPNREEARKFLEKMQDRLPDVPAFAKPTIDKARGKLRRAFNWVREQTGL